MAGETRGGGPGGIFPSGPRKFHFLGGTRGTQYITKKTVFSNHNSCIGDFGPFETLGDSVGKVVSRPKFAEQISVEVGEQNVIFTGIIFFSKYGKQN